MIIWWPWSTQSSSPHHIETEASGCIWYVQFLCSSLGERVIIPSSSTNTFYNTSTSLSNSVCVTKTGWFCCKHQWVFKIVRVCVSIFSLPIGQICLFALSDESKVMMSRYLKDCEPVTRPNQSVSITDLGAFSWWCRFIIKHIVLNNTLEGNRAWH